MINHIRTGKMPNFLSGAAVGNFGQ
jgi:hypothetical protein